MTNLPSNPGAPANPYVGPRPFETGRPLYGRDRETLDLLDLLIAERIVLLCSPSGSGKTSLIQAALRPRLEQEEFRVSSIIRVNAEPPPGLEAKVAAEGGTFNRYLFSVLLSLENDLPPDQRTPLDQLARMDLTSYLQQHAPPTGETVLIFDQFEEILTVEPMNQAAKSDFFAQVGDTLRDRRYWALFAMREDFLAGLDPYLRPIPTRFKTRFRLDLLSEQEAREAIELPAKAAGRPFSGQAAQILVDNLRTARIQQPDGTILEMPGPNVEPVQLQVVCFRLWEKLPPEAVEITREDVEANANVDMALEDYFNESMATVARVTGVRESVLREWIEHSLITETGMRGQVPRGRERTEGLDNAVLQPLVNTYLVRAEERRGIPWYELAHDRLIVPIRKNNAVWREANWSTLQRQAALWESSQRSSDLLFLGPTLLEAETWAEANRNQLTESESDFLKASRAAREIDRRQRQQAKLIAKLAVGASCACIIGLVFLAWAIHATGKAELQRDAARRAEKQGRVLQSEGLAGEALEQLENQPDLSMLLSLQAYRINDSLAARGSLFASLEAHPRLTQILHGHVHAVRCLAFSPDARLLASGSSDGVIRLWDMTGRAQPIRLQAQAAVVAVIFSPDGRLLATGGDDNAITLWDVATYRPTAVLKGHQGHISFLAFSPDGKLLASGGQDKTVLLWDMTVHPAASSLLTQVQTQGRDQIASIAFSRDGKTLAFANARDGEVKFYDVATRKEIPIPGTNRPRGLYVTFSPTENLLALVGWKGYVQLWDPDHHVLIPLGKSSSSGEDLVFSPDGKLLATGTLDGTIVFWDIASRKQIGSPMHSPGDLLWCMAFSPDGQKLASGNLDSTIDVWEASPNIANHRLLQGHSGILGMALSRDGTRVAAGGRDGTVTLWDTATGQRIGQSSKIHAHGGVDSVAFSADGSFLASAGGDDFVGATDTKTCLPHSPAHYRRPDVAGTTDSGFGCVAFSPDGNMLAAGTVDRNILLWNLKTGQMQTLPKRHALNVIRLAFSPDSRVLASRAGGWIGLEGADATIRLWDVSRFPRGGAVLPKGTIPLHSSNGFDFAFSPDSKLLASSFGDKSVVFWNVATLNLVGPQLSGHTAGVTALAFSRDGKWLASGGVDKTVILWDMESRHRIGLPLQGHGAAIKSLAFSADGKKLISAAADCSLISWDVDPASWVARAQRVAGRVNGNVLQDLGEEHYHKLFSDAP